MTMKMQEKSFWDDPDKAREVTSEGKSIEAKLKTVCDLDKKFEDILLLAEMTEGDEGVERELYREFIDFEEEVENFLLTIHLKGEYDGNNAILSLHVGVGGTDAQDFTEMLMRMYMKWAEKNGYKTEILDLIPGDEAGIRDASIKISGENVYGFLKSEKGIHRLVRISPYNTNNKRQTSFASVEILPELTPAQDVEINPLDIKTDTFRASGAGGQHVNKTDSAVRMTHIPTGIVVQCQNERSQHHNKDVALSLLKAKLVELKERAHKDKIEELSGELKDMGWGSQIRSYVFNPYQMVKDHRTLAETANVSGVLDGDIDLFIRAFLKSNAQEGN